MPIHNDSSSIEHAVAAPPTPALRWLEEHGDALYEFALRRVRRADLAEDLVQETLLAALTAKSQFSGRSKQRTWLLGIMRHKLIDSLRKTFRQQARAEAESDGSAEFFDERGRWKIKVGAWRDDPARTAENAEFREVLESCLAKLPPRVAQVFWLREAQEMESGSICDELQITRPNLWAMLHRARLGLRRCLSIHWFENGEE